MFITKISKINFLQNAIIQKIAIETMKTPNPNFIKFIPVGHSVLGDQGTLDISSV